jgi:uncharacterized protein (TIGR03067 family)
MTDLDRLQGSWDIASLEMDGHAMPSPAGSRIVIEGSKFQSLGMGATYEGKLEIDARKKPKQFDLVFTAGPEEGNRSLGIYELNGDSWKICFTVTGTRRPTEFETTGGSGLALETLTRGSVGSAQAAVEAALPHPPSPAPHPLLSNPVPEIEGEWQMVACSADGYPAPESMIKTGRRVARNGETASWFGSRKIMQARYSVDRSSNPHSIDYSLSGGHSQFGIWKLERGILHICFAPAGKPRPTSFETQPGQGHTFTSWKLVKK